jgi:membrane protein DedA with SNARE-associated domain
MWEELLKAFTIVLLPSALKFFIGPIGGYLAQLNIVTNIIATIAGMMTSVVAFTFFGDWLRDKVINRIFKKKKKDSTSKKRKLLQLWNKYGLTGVAALTPVLFTPIGGTIVAVSFRAPKKKILLYMLISAVCWSLAINGVLYYFGQGILPDFLK